MLHYSLWNNSISLFENYKSGKFLNLANNFQTKKFNFSRDEAIGLILDSDSDSDGEPDFLGFEDTSDQDENGHSSDGSEQDENGDGSDQDGNGDGSDQDENGDGSDEHVENNSDSSDDE
jgi:hypothetical protein